MYEIRIRDCNSDWFVRIATFGSKKKAFSFLQKTAGSFLSIYALDRPNVIIEVNLIKEIYY